MLRTIIMLTMLFMATFLSGVVVASYMQDTEYDMSFLNPEDNLLESVIKVDPVDNNAEFYQTLPEKASPFDRIKEEQIEVYNDKIIINLQGASWAKFTDTNSMDPVIDYGSNAIEVRPTSEQDIHVGDIISYDDGKGNMIIHRVVQTGTDDYGWYAVMKGDNALRNDPEKVRFEQVGNVVAIIIY